MDKPFALIVEDDRDIAALFRHVLDIAGYRTEIVMDGRDAMERLGNTRPDIVLLDLTLPGIPGPKILEHMRADSHSKDIPVVVVTAHAHIADSLPVAPDLILLKPVNLSQLSNLVQRLRTTPHSMGLTPWDPVTHLYNKDFFHVRLSYSLERARQIGVNRFGVMFVQVQPFDKLRLYVAHEQVDIFLREIAGHLKTSLRPTDTVAYLGEGRFLILIEDIPHYSAPSMIADRIKRDLDAFIGGRQLVDRLQAVVGLLICQAHYESVEEILGDVEIAVKLSANGRNLVEYERDMLRKLREAG
jgi:diguanylate cyclase (GGDEF)-like protein